MQINILHIQTVTKNRPHIIIHRKSKEMTRDFCSPLMGSCYKNFLTIFALFFKCKCQRVAGKNILIARCIRELSFSMETS